MKEARMSPTQAKSPRPNDGEEILSKVVLFTELRENRDAFTKLFSFMRELDFKAGETIIQEGDQGTEFFILADGTVSVLKKTQEGEPYKVAVLHGHLGIFFGEGALLEADTRTATIRADSACRCFALNADDFEKFSTAHPDWALPILKRVAQAVMGRLKNMNRDMSLLYKALVDEFARSGTD
jgi:CRP/FNR family transcriptional regulator